MWFFSYWLQAHLLLSFVFSPLQDWRMGTLEFKQVILCEFIRFRDSYLLNMLDMEKIKLEEINSL